MAQGKIHLYTGDGKGKTTCALGLCLRAAGHGKRILWTSFLKDYTSGEFLGTPPFTLHRGRPMSGFFPMLSEAEKAAARAEGKERLAAVFARAGREGYDMLVLDEVCAGLTLGLVDEKELLGLLASRPAALEVVLTGRDAPEAVRAAADYVSVIRAEKHPFAQGVPAREGIEW